MGEKEGAQGFVRLFTSREGKGNPGRGNRDFGLPEKKKKKGGDRPPLLRHVISKEDGGGTGLDGKGDPADSSGPEYVNEKGGGDIMGAPPFPVKREGDPLEIYPPKGGKGWRLYPP